MEVDEEGTLSTLTSYRRDVLEPAIARYRGRVVKTTGDGLLVEFSSAVDAVRCAAAIQTELAGRYFPQAVFAWRAMSTVVTQSGGD